MGAMPAFSAHTRRMSQDNRCVPATFRPPPRQQCTAPDPVMRAAWRPVCAFNQLHRPKFLHASLRGLKTTVAACRVARRRHTARPTWTTRPRATTSSDAAAADQGAALFWAAAPRLNWQKHRLDGRH